MVYILNPEQDEKWKDRPLSYVVKWFMKHFGLSVQSAAFLLNYNEAYFNNKLHRNSFTITNLIELLSFGGYSLAFVSEDNETIYKLDSRDYIRRYDPDMSKRLGQHKVVTYKKAKREYEIAKKKLEMLEREYGLEDDIYRSNTNA